MEKQILTLSKLPSLDGLRAVSISLVLLCHFFWEEKIPTGETGVGVFFVISGFLITTLLIKEKLKTGTISLKNFYLRRCFRILPIIFLFLFVLALLNYIFNLGISTISFIASIFFLKNFPIPDSFNWYTGHFWSLAIEEQFYLIFPFLLARLSIKNYKRLIIALLFIIPILNYLYYNSIGIFYSNKSIHIITGAVCLIFSKYTFQILVGSFFSCLLIEGNPIFKINKLTGHYFFSITLFAIAIFIGLVPVFGYFSTYIFALLIGYVIINNTLTSSLFSTFLNLKPVAFFGILSYSLYVWQQIFSHYQPWAGLFRYGDSKILNFIALMVVAYVSYTFYEKKFLRMKSKFY